MIAPITHVQQMDLIPYACVPSIIEKFNPTSAAGKYSPYASGKQPNSKQI
jgi:hypothetical protein